MPARYISIAAPDRSKKVPISDGSNLSLALPMDAHAAQSAVIVCREVICSSQPWRQIVQTGVSSVTPGCVTILCTNRAHCRTGQRFASSVLTVSCFMSFFCILKVIATLSANSTLSKEAKSRCPSLKNLKFLRQRSFVRFCSLLGTLEHSQDLQAKKLHQ